MNFIKELYHRIFWRRKLCDSCSHGESTSNWSACMFCEKGSQFSPVYGGFAEGMRSAEERMDEYERKAREAKRIRNALEL